MACNGRLSLEIFALPNAQLAQITPSKYPRVVHVIEVESHRIIADRDYIQDGYIALAADRLAFRGCMPLNLRARAAHAQIFRAQGIS